MSPRQFRAGLVVLAVAYTFLFIAIIPPALIDRGFDFWGMALDTFDTPSAAAVSSDVLLSYAVLALWVAYEAVTRKVRRGWVALLLGLVTGMTVALAAYLLIRTRSVTSDALGQ